LSISKSSNYYKPVIPFSSDGDQKLLDTIDKIYTKYPYYGHRRVHKLLGRFGFTVGRKRVKRAMALMGITAQYPKPKTTQANKEHLKYPYLLKELKNDKNQVVTQEDIYPSSYSTIKEARVGIGKYIDIYNKERLHQSLDYATPDEVYFKGADRGVSSTVFDEF